MTIARFILTGLGIFSASFSALASDGPVDLSGLIRAAETVNAGLTAAQLQEKVSQARISVRQGDYLPSLEADVADSWGYAGASGSMGIAGLAGSPFRSGVGADLLLSGTIWDFGRTTALVHAAQHEAEADKADIEVRRGEIDREATTLYLDCVRNQSQVETWTFVVKEAKQVDREVRKFVSTGQRSVVDKYLALAQLEQGKTELSDYETRLALSHKRLEILTQLPKDKIQCTSVESISEDIPKILESRSNPVLKRDAERVQVAKSQLDQIKADYLPKLKGYATAGFLEDSHLLPKDDYAVGVGLTLPLFDGFKTVNGVQEAQADAQKQEFLLGETRYRVEQTNAKYDLLIESSQDRLNHIQAEIKTIEQGFSVARERYFTFRGTLVDLREALRNLASVRTDLIDTKTSLLAASLEKEIFNGSRVKP